MFGSVYFAQSWLYFGLQINSSTPPETPGNTGNTGSGTPQNPPPVQSPQLFDTPVIPLGFRVDGRTTQESLRP